MKPTPGSGLIIAAPQSGSGKTTVTLGLLRAFQRAGINVAPAKAGPDYIDPAFHSIAAGKPSVNLDPWAMRPQLLCLLANQQAGNGPLLVEAMMGLFDGAADSTGSAADLAALLNYPVVLVVDAARQSHSIAALVKGFRDHRQDIELAGVILNRVGSERHEKMLRSALEAEEIAVLGAVPRDERLALPSRHLGLVQAGEHCELEDFIDNAAEIVASHVSLDVIANLFAGGAGGAGNCVALEPPGSKIAIASDIAFAFCYEHLLRGWSQSGVEISLFSPLADEPPSSKANAIYLPGGYPELHGEKLAQCSNFLDGLGQHADSGTLIYGECGGYMVLGEGIVDKDGQRHKMAGLLPLVTSFEQPKLHLGYRRVKTLNNQELFGGANAFTAHEFHYSSVLEQGDGEPLFQAEDALGKQLGSFGLRRKNVMGSYMHVIDRVET